MSWLSRLWGSSPTPSSSYPSPSPSNSPTPPPSNHSPSLRPSDIPLLPSAYEVSSIEPKRIQKAVIVPWNQAKIEANANFNRKVKEIAEDNLAKKS